jgi:hypothetical protein
MEEIWRDIEGFEGLYQVSNIGRVKNIKRGKVLAERLNSKGYPCALLFKDGVGRNVKIHQIVVNTFIGKIPKGYEIDHINTIRNDNRVENLRIVTHKENMNNPNTIKKMRGKVGELNPNFGRKASFETKEKIRAFLLSDRNPRRGSHLSETHKQRIADANRGKACSEETKNKLSKPIVQYDLDGNFIKEWGSATIVQNELGFNKSNICNCCTGKLKYAYGFIWRYKI